MVTRAVSTLFVAVTLALHASRALAQGPEGGTATREPAAAETPAATAEAQRPVMARPRLLHAPIAVANAHERILVYADLVEPELVKRAYVVYVLAGGHPPKSVDLQRAAHFAGYVAEIPASNVTAPGLGYTIELELTDGTRVSAFATRDAMQRVAVAEAYLDIRERALLARLHGRRSVVSAEGEYVSFGESETVVFSPAGYGIRQVPDRDYRVEGAYTFRPLQFVTEFSIRMGVIRGEAPAPAAVFRGDDALNVGLDYIAPSVRLRATDDVHVDLEGLTGLTEERFRVGALSRLLLGDPYGSKLVLGIQGIQGFGARFWTRVDLTATDRLMVSPIIEATNWPHADAYGVRLLLELTTDLGSGFSAVLGGGYQARQATSGGPSGNLSLRSSF